MIMLVEQKLEQESLPSTRI